MMVHAADRPFNVTRCVAFSLSSLCHSGILGIVVVLIIRHSSSILAIPFLSDASFCGFLSLALSLCQRFRFFFLWLFDLFSPHYSIDLCDSPSLSLKLVRTVFLKRRHIYTHKDTKIQRIVLCVCVSIGLSNFWTGRNTNSYSIHKYIHTNHITTKHKHLN